MPISSNQTHRSFRGALGCAFRFLTVLPISYQAERDSELFPQSVSFFPLIGVVIGGLAAGFCRFAGGVWPLGVASFIAVVFLSGISGFLHLDGLADSGDGLLSHRPREKSLSIMKDSRIGSMGVVVLMLVLGGKYISLATLSLPQLILCVFLMPIAGRVAILLSMAWFSYAREEGGLGALFYSSAMRKKALAGVSLLLICSLVTAGVLPALVILSTTLCISYGFGQFCKKRIGGVTGDTLGAVCELVELGTALSLSALLY